ncbi:insulinase family protein [bacterium]|nr:insulinase family protein [bacterium]
MKRKFNNLDLELYEETLENGLRVYMIPKKNVSNIYVTFTTKYGSVDTTFELDGKKITSPNGIAHFLEHKMFEAKNGIDPFTIFDQNGASSNAATSNYKTSYLFAGPTKLKENLTTLLDFVQEPYFTDENVEKEKGIIIEEIKMCEDQPGRVGYNATLENAFVKHPIRIPVIGSEKSVKSITKEDLYQCYKAFYHPKNMFLVITGNINPKETLKIIKENQNKKTFEENYQKKVIFEKEPDKVAKKKTIHYQNVTIPKVYYSYKINVENFDMNIRFITKYLSIYLDSLYGSVSDFAEEVEVKKIVNNGVDFIISKTDSHLVITFIAETKKTNALIKIIKKYMGKEITIDDFNRKKKIMLSSNIYMSDNIFRLNNYVTDNILNYDEVMTDIYEENKNLKYQNMISLIQKINFKNTTTVIFL